MLLDFQSKDDAIAVVADHPSRLDEASQIAQRLCANGQTVITIFKGNSKKQAEKEKSAGVGDILYVRDDERLNRRLHLQEISRVDVGAMERRLKNILLLPE